MPVSNDPPRVTVKVPVVPTVVPAIAVPPSETPTSKPSTSDTAGNQFEGNGGKAQPLAGKLANAATLSALSLRAVQSGVDPALVAKLANPAELKRVVAEFSKALMETNGAVITPEHEKKVFETLGAIRAAGKLGEAVAMLAEQAAGSGALPANFPPEKKDALVKQFTGLLDAEIIARDDNPEGNFISWEQASIAHLKAVRTTSVPPKGPGNPSAHTDPRFVKELETLAGAKFTSGNSITPLIDGTASFKERDRLIDGATKSIHMMSWAFYDDATGKETVAKLIAAKSRGVDVKIMVDGNTSQQHGHGDMLKLLEEAGIQVVRWNDPLRPYDGQHRKLLVVDGHSAIAGGLNVGDVYSHKGPDGTPKWRDTDVLIEGPAVIDSERLFASLWNEQKKTRHLDIDRVKVPAAPAHAKPIEAGEKLSGRIQVVDDKPGPDGDSHILLAALKAIEGATTSLDIENAYFITTPALKEAILAALERGVKVRILTNSAESVDEAIVTAPILGSLPELITAGAEVYLKKGDTLHSKFLVVDGLFSMVGSYNLHPRSERYEGEVCMNVLDEVFAANMLSTFRDDIAKATRMNKPEDVVVPRSPLTILAARFFFDQL